MIHSSRLHNINKIATSELHYKRKQGYRPNNFHFQFVRGIGNARRVRTIQALAVGRVEWGAWGGSDPHDVVVIGSSFRLHQSS